jgi:hypothetical protein
MAAAQVRGPIGSVPGDVTRYLCAAAYFDERFADRVVEDVVADEASAVAPSPDVDLVAVAHHCLAAQEIRYRRDMRLTGAVGIVALFAPLWLMFVAVLLWIARMVSRSRPSLARLLEEHRAALADPDATAREMRRLREELDEDEPQLPVLQRALDRLTAFVEPVTPLVVAVGQLAQTVQGT